MEFKVVWSGRAIADLEELCNYIATENPEAAYNTGQGILNHVGILSSFPYIGPSFPRGEKGNIREIVFRPYRIFYEVNETARKVEILHVRHGARREQKP